MTESEVTDRGPNQPAVGTVRFLSLSVVFSSVAAALVLGGYALFDGEIRTKVMIFAVVAGFGVSTSGWYIVARGFGDVPERMLAYFGAGMLTKLVLLGLTVALVKTFEIASLEEFLVPFSAVFFLTGFAQLFIAIKGATKLLNEANEGRVWEQPAAPGVARRPKKREERDSQDD